MTILGGPRRLDDLLGDARYDRNGTDLASRGIYLDLPPWGFHVFVVGVAAAAVKLLFSREHEGTPCGINNR